MYHIKSEAGLEHKIARAIVQNALKNKVDQWEWVKVKDQEYSLISDNKSYHIFIDSINKDNKTVQLYVDSQYFDLALEEPIDVLLKEMGIDMASAQKLESLKAPMPGLVLKILVEEGQEIKKGEPLLILEAMKMENVFKASADATIGQIMVEEGQAVEKSAILIELV